mgnify:CR=1 FL=1
MSRALVSALLLLSVVVPSLRAHAYVVKGQGWQESRVRFHVDPAVDDAIPGASAALQSAAEAWGAQPGVPRLELEPSATPVPRDGADRENVVAVYTEGWPFGSNLLAATVVVRRLLDRHILSSDIYVNCLLYTSPSPRD